MRTEELLDLCAKKEAQFMRPGQTNGDRLMAAMPELPEEDVWDLVKAVVTYADEKIRKYGGIQASLILMMMGVEMGRELERQAVRERSGKLSEGFPDG